MPHFTTSKIFSFVMFLLMMVLFFIWIVGQVSDLGLFFGFRTSHTVANDLANIVTSLSAVPGDISYKYNIGKSGDSDIESREEIKYDIKFSDKLVCVSSYLGEAVRATTDCAGYPYPISEKEFKEVSSICLKFDKKFIVTDDGQESQMIVEEC